MLVFLGRNKCNNYTGSNAIRVIKFKVYTILGVDLDIWFLVELP